MTKKMNEQTLQNILTIISIFSILFLVGCVQDNVAQNSEAEQVNDKKTETNFESTDDLKKFESKEEIIEFLNSESNRPYNNYYSGFGRGFGGDIAVMATEESADSSAPMAMVKSTLGSSGQSASDYSTTNIQVEGVDEADFIKNDGKYIYIVQNGKLVIVDAFPADDAEILSETIIGESSSDSDSAAKRIAPDYYYNSINELFINGDRLVVFAQTNVESFMLPQYDVIPRPRYTQRTHAYVYDISDRENPELLEDYNLNGNYFDARMIGDYVYFIVKDSVYYYDQIIDVPMLREGDSIAIEPAIYYFDNPEGNYVFHTIASFNIADSDDLNAESYMMGYSNNLYVSENNIYITYQKNVPYYWYRNNNEDRFFEVVVPMLPSDVQSEIKAIKAANYNTAEEWNKISNVVQDMYDRMGEREKNNLIEEISEAVQEYEAKLEAERRKTVIHKIAISKGDIDYDTKGEVPGHILNQFSMDEHDGHFRVATTTFVWNARDNTMYNNVFVLDSDLDIVGQIEDIAPEERIYSARFIGDRLYMVTFKNIDPFFVIDLSDPKNPEILGELKIPGFSDYLHPYDENHIIGIGKETEGNEWGGVSTKGVKLALFDVTDVNNPKEVDKYEIGESGTDSEALRDHKAFLFDREKDLLVIPVREVTGRYKDLRYGYFRNSIWQGAYVFSLTPEDGFSVKGKVTHEGKEDDSYYWNSPNAVKRSLFMDDVLYTVSQKQILMNDLDDLSDEINSVDLPQREEKRWYDDHEPVPLPIARSSVGIAEPELAVETVDFVEG